MKISKPIRKAYYRAAVAACTPAVVYVIGKGIVLGGLYALWYAARRVLWGDKRLPQPLPFMGLSRPVEAILQYSAREQDKANAL